MINDNEELAYSSKSSCIWDKFCMWLRSQKRPWEILIFKALHNKTHLMKDYRQGKPNFIKENTVAIQFWYAALTRQSEITIAYQ